MDRRTPFPLPGRGLLVAAAFLILASPARALEPGEFDPTPLDGLFAKYVAGGRVDYAAWKTGGIAALDAFLDSAAAYDLTSVMGKEPRAAFLLNAYHAWAIRQVLEHYPVKSVKDIPGFFDKNAHLVAGETRTLDGIEGALAELLPHRPEVFLALCSGAAGGPSLVEIAFRSDNFEKLLQKVLKEGIDRGRIHYDSAANEIHYPPEVERHMAAYEALPHGVLSPLNPYLPLGVITAITNKNPKVVFDPVDWSLNEIPPRQSGAGGSSPP